YGGRARPWKKPYQRLLNWPVRLPFLMAANPHQRADRRPAGIFYRPETALKITATGQCRLPAPRQRRAYARRDNRNRNRHPVPVGWLTAQYAAPPAAISSRSAIRYQYECRKTETGLYARASGRATRCAVAA